MFIAAAASHSCICTFHLPINRVRLSPCNSLAKAITLLPGDLIFTGIPGIPQAMKPGDVVEVELSGIGILRNPIVAET